MNIVNSVVLKSNSLLKKSREKKQENKKQENKKQEVPVGKEILYHFHDHNLCNQFSLLFHFLLPGTQTAGK